MNCKHSLVILVFVTLFLAIRGEKKTINQLRDYEIVERNAVKRHTIARRSAESGNNRNESVEHLVTFRAINKDFNLLLSHNKDIITSDDFNAFAVDSNGRKEPIVVDSNEFYLGRVDGIKGSSVRAHIGSDGVMMASIQTGDETYEVEPIWRHLADHPNRDSMIIYKRSDVLTHSSTVSTADQKSRQFCDFIKFGDNVTNEYIEAEERIRRKRDTLYDFSQMAVSDEINAQFRPTQTHCAIVLVADHYFFESMGDGNQKTTINYLIHIIDRVNNIFNNTEWTDDERRPGFKGMGFFIKEIQIHTEPTVDIDHYNSLYSRRSVREVLEAFSLNKDNSQFCLAHLFTHRSFDGSVLGLAYVASPRMSSVGGICSPSYYGSTSSNTAGRNLYLNTGLTTTRNSFGQRIITREAVLVTAHEFGHNWGSEHDPHTEECSPPAQRGGSYVMYTYSVSGYEENNRFFSPCSKRSIRAVLVAKSGRCFSKPDRSYCGNSKVEADEECDEGILVKGDEYVTGLCCDSKCKLIAGSYCSDKNSDCCASCKIRPAGIVCKHKDELNCKQESHCDGESDKCPEPTPLANETPCLDRGQCRAGKCITYCEAIGMMPCLCEDSRDACVRCCRSNTTLYHACRPVTPRDPLPNGTPCKFGFCENQRCEKNIQDFVERFWDVIEEININTFFRFMKDNIVGAVIMITLLIWVPIGCAINFYDQRHKEKLKKRSASFGSDASQRRVNLRPRSFNSVLSRPSVRGDRGDRLTQTSVYYPPGYRY